MSDRRREGGGSSHRKKRGESKKPTKTSNKKKTTGSGSKKKTKKHDDDRMDFEEDELFVEKQEEDGIETTVDGEAKTEAAGVSHFGVRGRETGVETMIETQREETEGKYAGPDWIEGKRITTMAEDTSRVFCLNCHAELKDPKTILYLYELNYDGKPILENLFGCFDDRGCRKTWIAENRNLPVDLYLQWCFADDEKHGLAHAIFPFKPAPHTMGKYRPGGRGLTEEQYRNSATPYGILRVKSSAQEYERTSVTAMPVEPLRGGDLPARSPLTGLPVVLLSLGDVLPPPRAPLVSPPGSVLATPSGRRGEDAVIATTLAPPGPRTYPSSGGSPEDEIDEFYQRIVIPTRHVPV